MERALKSEIIYISTIVLGELFAGFKGGSKIKENIELLEKTLANPFVEAIDVNQYTAEIYGDIKYTPFAKKERRFLLMIYGLLLMQ